MNLEYFNDTPIYEITACCSFYKQKLHFDNEKNIKLFFFSNESNWVV